MRGRSEDAGVEREGEHRAFAEFALGLKLAAHEPREAKRNGKAEARAIAFGANAAAPKDQRELRTRHASAGVCDREREAHVAVLFDCSACRRTRTPPWVV